MDCDEHTGTDIFEADDAHKHRLRSDESAQVGTTEEPEPRAPVRGVKRRRPAPRPNTYRAIRAYVYAHHGFSPRTGWIANVKELNGVPLRPTHNRSSAARVDACPPERRSGIEEALRHFGVL